jgi:hypothetical protein
LDGVDDCSSVAIWATTRWWRPWSRM